MNPDEYPVKPRKHGYAGDLPIIIGTRHCVYSHATGEMVDHERMGRFFRQQPPSLFISSDIAWYANRLHTLFQGDPSWQMVFSPFETTRINGEGDSYPVNGVRIHRFGWSVPDDRNTSSRMHHPIDTGVLLGKPWQESFPDRANDEVGVLLSLARDLQAFCRENDMKLAGTRGGLGSQLLKDPRFYPEARRKVPRATNEKIRPYLPGNFYDIVTPAYDINPGHNYGDVTCSDQSRAHHRAVLNTKLPDSNNFYARGHFHGLHGDHRYLAPWLYANEPAGQELLDNHEGMLAMVVQLREDHPLVPEWLNDPERNCVEVLGNDMYLMYRFTNELWWIDRNDIQHIVAAWTSPQTDQGLPKYAQWAIDTLDRASDLRKTWLKPTLLSVYGLLASAPRSMAFGFARSESKGVTEQAVRVGPTQIKLKVTAPTKPVEPGYTHVCQRAMIEVETRDQSLLAAQLLQRKGHHVLSIYADAVFTGGHNTDTPHPWTSEHLTNFKLLNLVSYTSDERIRTPGVPKRTRNRNGARYPARDVIHSTGQRPEGVPHGSQESDAGPEVGAGDAAGDAGVRAGARGGRGA